MFLKTVPLCSGVTAAQPHVTRDEIFWLCSSTRKKVIKAERVGSEALKTKARGGQALKAQHGRPTGPCQGTVLLPQRSGFPKQGLLQPRATHTSREKWPCFSRIHQGCHNPGVMSKLPQGL